MATAAWHGRRCGRWYPSRNCWHGGNWRRWRRGRYYGGAAFTRRRGRQRRQFYYDAILLAAPEYHHRHGWSRRRRRCGGCNTVSQAHHQWRQWCKLRRGRWRRRRHAVHDLNPHSGAGASGLIVIAYGARPDSRCVERLIGRQRHTRTAIRPRLPQVRAKVYVQSSQLNTTAGNTTPNLLLVLGLRLITLVKISSEAVSSVGTIQPRLILPMVLFTKAQLLPDYQSVVRLQMATLSAWRGMPLLKRFGFARIAVIGTAMLRLIRQPARMGWISRRLPIVLPIIFLLLAAPLADYQPSSALRLRT